MSTDRWISNGLDKREQSLRRCGVVIATNIDEPFDKAELRQFRKPGSVTKRMIKWELYSIDSPQEDIADIVIHPDTSGVGLITTKRKAGRKAIEAGRAAAEAALPRIREKLKNMGAFVENKATNGVK